MSKKRGLSVDDKRRVILKIYHDGNQPYNLKEIENFGAKAGVVAQTIKDINQSLVDDSLVTCEKIGSANFYWSFPSKVANDKAQQKVKLENIENSTNQQIIEYENLKKNLLETRPPSIDRTNQMIQLEKLTILNNELTSQLEALKENDPERIAEIQKQTKINFESVNRWTDNVWAVKKYLTKKKGMIGKEVDKMLSIGVDFDYITLDKSLK
eukprot:TRINITY_DN102923_c0_g1_i1.p1 TRINITY_DN102923_c0_g1~~TRINITY_DN102923_c0_g1_i1.p1  ORF type:complete len:211 (+),score=5.78 TRINITY_DN102923_c0_g1_i1:47-679(+)